MKKFTAVIKRSGNQFVTLCLELGVVGTGSTKQKALESLKDAIDSYLDYSKEVGLPDTRPIAIQALHEFLFHEEAEPVKAQDGTAQITTLAYA